MESEQQLLGQLEQLRRAGRLSDAMLVARELVRRDPDSALGRRVLGELLLQSGKPNDACLSLHKAVSLNATDPLALNHLGRALNNLRRLDEATEAFERALVLNENYAEAWHNLGHVRRLRGDLAGAARAFRRALEIDGDYAPAWHKLGLVQLARADYDEARRSLATARRLAPDDPRVLVGHGIALHNLAEYEDAVAAFTRALEFEANSVDAHANLAITLHELKRFDCAVEHYRAAVALAPDDAALPPKLCDALLATARAGEALEVADAALARHPGLAGAIAARTVALTQLQRTREVQRLLDYDSLLFRERVERVPGFASIQRFNQALAEFVSAHETLRYERPGNATRRGGHTGDLLAGDKGPVALLEQQVQRALERVRQSLLDGAGPYSRRVPARWRLNMWAVVMDQYGHQLPHIHPTAWISGVYYVMLPDSAVATPAAKPGSTGAGALALAAGAQHETRESPAEAPPGWIEFGRPPDDILGEHRPPTRFVQPRVGEMLLFPSYFYHRTVPYRDDQRRISIAFDAIAVEG